jgi:subtilisin-like proprotein convertase family protein
MFTSGRALTSNSSLLAVWNFDGNLRNFTSAGPSINASFNNGAVNNCRLSAYTNEGTPGVYSSQYSAHSTVINRGGTPNAYPSGFTQNVPHLPIPDNNPTGISDSITIYNPVVPVSSIEVFLSVKHTWVWDLIISLRAPNGQVRNLISQNDGGADNVLSFFGDAFPNLPSTTNYLPPWAFVKPIQAFGNFGGASVNGTWTIKCADVYGSDIGVLEGWGIRFNNLVGIEPVSGNIPSKFRLYQNYPNPFNPVTNIRFDLPVSGSRRIKIILYDILGREVMLLTDEFRNAGEYNLRIDVSGLSSGTYFYRMVVDSFPKESTIGEAGEFTDVKKLVVLR